MQVPGVYSLAIGLDGTDYMQERIKERFMLAIDGSISSEPMGQRGLDL